MNIKFQMEIKKKTKKEFFALFIAVVVVMLLATSCKQKQSESQTPIKEEPISKPFVVTEEQKVEDGKATSPNIKKFNITAKQWSFEPSTIIVNKNDKVILNIKSIDVTHGFALPDFKINEKIMPGKTVTVEFIADKTGEFKFFCSVPCGEGHGNMQGKLIVK